MRAGPTAAIPPLPPSPHRSAATTHLLDFLDVAVVVAGRAGLAGLDALVVLEQGGDLRAQRGVSGRPSTSRHVPAAEDKPTSTRRQGTAGASS